MANEVREVLFNDGEGLVYTDLNDMQRFTRAQLWDEAIAARFRVLSGSANESGGLLPVSANGELYSYGGAYLRAGGSTRSLTNASGLIFMQSDSFSSFPTGADAKVYPYFLSSGDISQVTAIGGANPRIDLVCVQLTVESADAADNRTTDFKDASTLAVTSQTFVKKRKIKLSQQLVQGTENPTPVEPAVPAGWVRLGAIYVPASHNAVHDFGANGRDHRFPAGSKVHMTHAFGPGPGVNVESGWATAITSGGLQSSAASQVVRIFPNAGGLHSARLLRVTVMGNLTGATVDLVRRYHDVAAGSNTDTVIDSTIGGAVGTSPKTVLTPNITRPIWLNGRMAGGECANLGSTYDQESLCIKITSSAANQIIRFVKWEVAEV